HRPAPFAFPLPQQEGSRAMKALPALAALAMAALLLPASAAFAQEAAREASARPARQPDVPYVPTPQNVVDGMLELAQVKKDDVLYDLGSGDGRIPVTAAKRYGVNALGIDINPQRVREANETARREGVTDLVTFRTG